MPLAKKLNIKAASLYWHIKDKQDLYDLLAEHIYQEMALPETLDDAQEALITLALEIRRVLLKTRDAVDIVWILSSNFYMVYELYCPGCLLIKIKRQIKIPMNFDLPFYNFFHIKSVDFFSILPN